MKPREKAQEMRRRLLMKQVNKNFSNRQHDGLTASSNLLVNVLSTFEIICQLHCFNRGWRSDNG